MFSSTNVDVRCVVGRLVSTQPPSSIEKSMMSERGFIARTMSRVTTIGARAPGTSTAPTTTSAKRTVFRTLKSCDTISTGFRPDP